MNKLPIVIITHTLPREWISSLEGECNPFIGPPDATELDPSLIDVLPEAVGLFTLLTIPVTGSILQPHSAGLQAGGFG